MPTHPAARSDDLIGRIRSRRSEMSPGYRRVADYLAENYEDAAFLPASRVADAVGVSESLVVRFAASLGYDGYPGMSRALQAMVKSRLSLPERLRRAPPELHEATPASDVLARVIELDRANLSETLAAQAQGAMDAVVTALLEARTVYLLGLRGPAHLAGLFGLLLDKAGADVRVVTQGDVVMFDRLRHLARGDLLFAFAFARYTRRTLDALRLARARGAATVALTDAPTSPVANEADLALSVHVASASFGHSYVAAVSVLNALVAAWTLRAPGRSLRSLEAIEELLPAGEFLT